MRPLGSRRWRPFAAAIALLSPSPAHADPAPVAVEWHAPAACPDQAAVTAAIQRVVGGETARDPVRVTGTVKEERSGGPWRLDLSVQSGGDAVARVLHGESCEALTDAAAVVVGLAVDPTARRETQAPPGKPAPVTPPVTPGETARPLAFVAALGLLVEDGTLPSVGGGAFLGAGLRAGRLDVGLEAAVAPRSTGTTAGNAAEGATFSMVRVGVRGCVALLTPAAFSLGPCGAGSVDVVAATGFGSQSPASDTAISFTPAVGFVARVSLSRRVGLRLLPELAFPLSRPAFIVAGLNGPSGFVHRAAPVTFRGGLGAEVAF